MNFNITGILTKYYIGKPSEYLNFLIIFVIGILVGTLAVGWDSSETSVTFFGVLLKLYGQNRDDSLVRFLNQIFSWGWVVAIFLLFSPIKKLSETFSVNEMLWLRLLPCSPYEVAIARALWIIGYAFFLGILGTAWAIICASFHQVSIRELLINVEGLVSHVLLSGGIVVALSLVIPIRKSEQNLISVIAMMLPLVLTLIYYGISGLQVQGVMKYFPYSSPFNPGLKNTFFHFGTATLIGVVLLGSHIVQTFRFSNIKFTAED